MKKKTITLLMVSMFSLHTMAQNVSNSEAFDIAQSFMAKKGITLVNKNVTRGESMPYKVFEGKDGIGYAVVQNGLVIEYATKSPASDCTIRANTRTFVETYKTPIEPMIVAKYDQTAFPYRNETPMVQNSKGEWGHAFCGCGPEELAEIMYYYKNEGATAIEAQDFGSNYAKLEALPPTTFDWSKILPTYDPYIVTEADGRYVLDANGLPLYEYPEYTDEEANEIAKLMKYIGYAMESQYDSSASGSWMRASRLPLLGFSDESYSTIDGWDIGTRKWWNAYDEWKLSDAEIYKVLDRELEKGRPILFSGYNRDGQNGHWWSIDGRDDTGRYHISGKSKDVFHIISPEMYMNNESAYLLMNVSYVWLVIPIMPKGWITSIGDKVVNLSNDDGTVYNLQGQKVGDSIEGLSKGIYIKNGKKQVVK